MSGRDGRVGRRVWAAVPFKGPAGSKRRLAGLLDAAEREQLSLAMLADVLERLLALPAIERTLVLAPPGAARGLTPHERLTVVDEPSAARGGPARDGLNAALRHAQRVAEDGGAEALLIVPSDVPLVTTADLAAMLAARASAAVAIAPDRAGDGTNALLLTPPGCLEPSFGTASFARHQAQAVARGLPCVVVERPTLALDLDTPADVALLLASGANGRAARLLREREVERRLAGLPAAQARSTTI